MQSSTNHQLEKYTERHLLEEQFVLLNLHRDLIASEVEHHLQALDPIKQPEITVDAVDVKQRDCHPSRQTFDVPGLLLL